MAQPARGFDAKQEASNLLMPITIGNTVGAAQDGLNPAVAALNMFGLNTKKALGDHPDAKAEVEQLNLQVSTPQPHLNYEKDKSGKITNQEAMDARVKQTDGTFYAGMESLMSSQKYQDMSDSKKAAEVKLLLAQRAAANANYYKDAPKSKERPLVPDVGQSVQRSIHNATTPRFR